VVTTESQLHAAIIRYVAEQGFAPTISTLTQQLGWSDAETRNALTKLSENRGVILKPNSLDLWAIHPFTLMPTARGEGQTIEFQVRDGRSTNSDLLIHFPFRPGEWWSNPYNPCGCILFFSADSQIDSWCARHGLPRGEAIDIATGVALAEEWFGDYMALTWKRKSRDEARQVFLSLGLSSEFWLGS
jgi:Alkylmercury lyase